MPLVAAAALAIPLLVTTDARACGGCYHRPSETETTVVTGHRMALSVSPAQTVLWDQIQYAGEPTEFAWVLPVRPGARIELSTDAWFETLDAATSVRIVSPELHCLPPPEAREGGCGSSDSALAGAAEDGFGGPPPDAVTVVHQGTVGPYETVTLSTDQAGALNDWLSSHGYGVDDGIQPVIDAYVEEGFDFVALRLLPGKGVREMKPVRVVSPGADPTLPLRMVAAGTGARVAITLFVIGEGRWATKNFPGADVSAQGLTWDFLTSESNFATLRQGLLAGDDGRTWLTSYAKHRALLSAVPNPTGFGQSVVYGPEFSDTIAAAYLAQASANNETGGVACDLGFLAHAGSPDVVVDTCAGAREPCPSPDAGNLDARAFACGAADDLAVALTGMHPRDVWLTRLESDLPRIALSVDLQLEAATPQAAVENWLTPTTTKNEQEACRSSGTSALSVPVPGSNDRGSGGRMRGLVTLTALGLALAAALGRRRLLARAGAS